MIADKDAPPPYEGPTEPTLSLSVLAHPTTEDVLITVTPPRSPPTYEKKSGFDRVPLDVCCVIDVSGSMGTAAIIPGENGQQAEVTSLSILDVVKHALRTIVAGLDVNDRIALVTFHNTAAVQAQLTLMDAAGKKMIQKRIESFCPLGGTNLWDGLKTGMDLLNVAAGVITKEKETSPATPTRFSFLRGSVSEKSDKKASEPEPARRASLFILTDGMPNVNPPRGHIPMLQEYLDANADSSFSINTFGFGYSLDSPLLLQIAELGGGHYGFIPDSGLVGTVFVHALANAMATCAVRCTLAVEVPQGAVVALHPATPGDVTTWGANIPLGDVQYGQTRDVVVRVAGGVREDGVPPKVTVTAKYWPATRNPKQQESLESTASAFLDANVAELKYNAWRQQIVADLYAAVPQGKQDEAAKKFHELAKEIEADGAGHDRSQALAEDIRGQILLALENGEYFQRWGRHYLPSLARAHQRQRCGNFKDAGLQVYGADSPVFLASRDTLDKAFDALPPPKPSRRQGKMVSSMSVWNISSGPCVASGSSIALASGRHVPVDRLRRRDVLASGRVVAGVLRTPVHGGETLLCTMGKLRVTPWHPVFVDGDWVFPADITSPALGVCDALYSVLLRPAPGATADALLIDGVPVIALGHGVKDHPVLGHAFLGDYSAVLSAMVCLPGFADDAGVATCVGTIRGADGRICGFLSPDEEPKLVLAVGSSIPLAA